MDGEGFSIPKLGKARVGHLRFACCDCGLVHDAVIINGRDSFGFAAQRNELATAAKRRKKPKKAKS